MASSSDEDMSSDYLYPLPTTIAIGVVTSFLAVVTTAFNAITLLAFVLSRSLRNFGDYFILNLAVRFHTFDVTNTSISRVCMGMGHW